MVLLEFVDAFHEAVFDFIIIIAGVINPLHEVLLFTMHEVMQCMFKISDFFKFNIIEKSVLCCKQTSCHRGDAHR